MVSSRTRAAIVSTNTLACVVSMFILFVQTIVLIEYQNIFLLKLNLILQIVLILVFVIWTRQNSGKFLNVPLVFLVTIYIWHSPFLTGHYFELADIFEWTGRHFTYGEQHVPRAVGLVSLCLISAAGGILLGYATQQKKNNSAPYGLMPGERIYVPRISKQLLLFSMFFYSFITAIYLLSEGAAAFSGDYLDLYTEHSNSFLYFFYQSSKFYFSLIVLAAFAFVSGKREFRILLVVTMCVILMQFLLGSRSVPFINLAALLFAIDYFIKRIPVFAVLLFVLLISASSFIIQYVRGAVDSSSITDILTSDKSALILHSLWEMGGTIRNVIRTMEFMGNNGIVYGQTFLNSSVYLLPKPFLDMFAFQPAILRPSEWLVVNSADIPYGGGIGYSLVAEAYYNFGLFGSFVFFAVGWFVSAKYFAYLKTGNRYSLLHALNVIIILLLHMRSDSEVYLRYIVYGSLFIELLRWFSLKRQGAYSENGATT